MAEDTPQQKQRFHHKHMPTLTRHSKWFGWKLMHLFFPMAIHWMTDKYEGRLHHLIVDVIYVVVTFTFLAANIAIGWWYLQYYTPADMDVQIFASEEVTSGEDMQLSVMLYNHERDIENVSIDVYMPERFIPTGEGQSVGEPMQYILGDVQRDAVERVDGAGGIFGSVGDEYTIRVVTTYTWAGRTQQEVTTHRVRVAETSFVAKSDFPDAVTYGYQLEGNITFNNKSDYARENVVFTADFPEGFTPQSFAYKQTQIIYNTETNEVVIPRVEAREKGNITVNGTFFRPEEPDVIAGDQVTDFDVDVRTEIARLRDVSQPSIAHDGIASAFKVVNPRLVASMTATPVVNYGQTVTATVVASNVGDVALEDVQLNATVTGDTVSNANSSVFVIDNGVSLSARGSATAIPFPLIEEIPAGESRTFTVRIPTAVLDTQNITSQVRVAGTAYSPEIDAVIPMNPLFAETRYNSRVNMSSELVYFGPDGDQIGYGPYPPQVDQPTAMRVVFRLNNINNQLRNVTVRTQLPSQVEWTGLSSVSAGATMQYNPADRTVTWQMPSLEPQSAVYGGQFEVRIMPNSQQVGLQPHVTGDIRLTAQDNHTNSFVEASTGAVVLPVAVEDFN